MIRKSLLIAGLVLAGCSGEQDETVATFRAGIVNASEFQERYERYLSQVAQRDNILLRKEILNNMINEQLILAAVDRSPLIESPETKERLEQITLQAMLDRYSRLVALDTVSVSEKEFQDEFRAYNSTVSVRYLYASTEDGAGRLKRELEAGATFEELAREVFQDPGLANNGGYLGSFRYGEMEPGLEEAAFSLPIGQISDPFPMRVGYGILRVESRTVQPLSSVYDYGKVKGELRHTIIHKKAARQLAGLSAELTEEMAPTFNDEALNLVAGYWQYMESSDPEMNVPEDISGFHLVSFRGGSWTVGEFLGKMGRTSERQRGRVREDQDIRDLITGLIVREELLNRAGEAGLSSDPEVRAQIDLLYAKYRLDEWRSAVLIRSEEAGWDEGLLRAQYEAEKERFAFPPEVNVAEVLVRTVQEASDIADAARNGADFGALAKEHSIRLWAAEQNGELGFGTRATFGILGEKFFDSEVGEILGPEYVEPYYGIFKILEKKPGRARSFDEARDQVIEESKTQRSNQALEQAIRDLRKGAEIEVNLDALANIRVRNQGKDQES